MRIRKVSQPSALPLDTAQVVDSYSTSTTDAYSANYVNEVNEKNIITIGLSSDYTIPKSNTGLQITGWTTLDTIGNKLSLSNNKIVIGPGVSKVMVSYIAGVGSTASATNINIYIRVNDKFISQDIASFGGTNQSETSICIPRLIDVAENDTIDLCIYGTQGNKVLYGYDTIRRTIMTVEVVE
jgi:hypothetical protein